MQPKTKLADSVRDGRSNFGALFPGTAKGLLILVMAVFVGVVQRFGRYLEQVPPGVVFGIELLDLRLKRINHDEGVRPESYDRMISERRQIAERVLSEGNGEAPRPGGGSQ